MIDKALTLIRGLVRPILTFAIIGIIAGLTFKCAALYLVKEAATMLVGFVAGAGTTVMAYWFGERKASK